MNHFWRVTWNGPDGPMHHVCGEDYKLAAGLLYEFEEYYRGADAYIEELYTDDSFAELLSDPDDRGWEAA